MQNSNHFSKSEFLVPYSINAWSNTIRIHRKHRGTTGVQSCMYQYSMEYDGYLTALKLENFIKSIPFEKEKTVD